MSYRSGDSANPENSSTRIAFLDVPSLWNLEITFDTAHPPFCYVRIKISCHKFLLPFDRCNTVLTDFYGVTIFTISNLFPKPNFFVNYKNVSMRVTNSFLTFQFISSKPELPKKFSSGPLKFLVSAMDHQTPLEKHL